MWIILNKSFLSIVKNRNDENELLVRAELKTYKEYLNAKFLKTQKSTTYIDLI